MDEAGSPESPEARRKGLGGRVHRRLGDLGVSDRAIEVMKRVAIGVWSDGFMHAGNLAYLSLLTLFPFFIVAAAIAKLLGQTGDGLHALNAFLETVPPDVADVLRKPISDVLAARSGLLLWLGALVGLWTTASFIETVRSILQRAYGTQSSRAFWEYRLGSIGLIIASVVLVMLSFSFQVVLTGIEQFIVRVLPFATGTAKAVSLTRIAPSLALFGALYMLFYSLTPSRYRYSKCPKWPGAAFTAAWWLATTALLPVVLGMLGGYDLTYGSMAGVMIALIFFFVVGLGVVMGAELNAALAEDPDEGLEDAQSKKEAKTS
ncbi:YihY/virulence factor BrkB family protein [Sphingomonadaceae bacterium LXI357]|uniref:YihY/virulence factor BrkB family protein n=1 Tax=Stakelama marina TaxID=2826939 RepID=A0A8T4IH99_9SPHN|nr:YihY/virulence factor BrkB family protein [Stakelama marina]MBR0554013.1 YihY/virulence factor BrkB family protein [Stakelama marina]